MQQEDTQNKLGRLLELMASNANNKYDPSIEFDDTGHRIKQGFTNDGNWGFAEENAYIAVGLLNELTEKFDNAFELIKQQSKRISLLLESILPIEDHSSELPPLSDFDSHKEMHFILTHVDNKTALDYALKISSYYGKTLYSKTKGLFTEADISHLIYSLKDDFCLYFDLDNCYFTEGAEEIIESSIRTGIINMKIGEGTAKRIIPLESSIPQFVIRTNHSVFLSKAILNSPKFVII